MVSFADRHIGTTAATQRQMLDALGVESELEDWSPVEALMLSLIHI